MPSLRGQSGYCALTGLLIGTPVIQDLVPLGGTLMDLEAAPGGTLTGNISYGQTFTVAGVAGTYTILDPDPPMDPANTASRRALNNQVLFLTFDPPAVVAFPAGAVVTVASTIFAQVRRWTLSRTLQALETTVMRQPARTYCGGRIGFTGVAEGLFDYADTGQQAFVDALVATHTGEIPFLTLGSSEITDYDAFVVAESVLVTEAVLTNVQDELATVVFSFRGKEPRGEMPLASLEEYYTASWEWPGVGTVEEYYTASWEV